MRDQAALTASGITQMLYRHYLPEGRLPGGLFASEVGSPCGKRRADALWLPTTIAGGTGLIGHEIKVSRSDLLVELADPTKADPWAKYCDRWWIVISDPALVDGLEIPEAWGIMAPPSGRRTRTMTVLRPAPKLNPIDPAPGLRRLIAWQLYGYGQRTEAAEATVSRRDQELEKLRSQLSNRAAIAAGIHVSEHTKRISEIVRKAEFRLHGVPDIWVPQLDDDIVVDAIVDAALTRRIAETTRNTIQRIIEQFDTDMDPLRYAKEQFAAACKELLQGQIDVRESA